MPKKEAITVELDKMMNNQIYIIATVTEPTDCVSSVRAVPSRHLPGSLRFDRNTAIKHSHYPLPTMDDVTSRLTKARVFSVMEVKSGFCQEKLTENSSYYTTFNTPFGRFRLLGMPFGISSVLGVVNYLSKFLPNLCSVSEPLRCVEVKDADARFTMKLSRI